MNTSPIPVLIADIGGTNARLSIVIIEKNKPIIEIDKKTYTTYAHKNLQRMLTVIRPLKGHIINSASDNR